MIDILYRRPSSSHSSQSVASSGISWLRSTSGIPPALAFDRIINGQTCFSIATYITAVPVTRFHELLHFIEHNAEYLKFYLWYRDYKKRFYALPESEQELSPPRDDTNQNMIPVLRKQNVNEEVTDIPNGNLNSESKFINGITKRLLYRDNLQWHARRTSKSMDIERRNSSARQCKSEAEQVAIQVMTDAHFDGGLESADLLLPFTVQPYRSEIARMLQTFLASGGPLELNLSSRDRNATLQALHMTNHPSALHSAIRVAEDVLRTHSHPNFTRRVVSNSNADRAASLNYIGYFLLVGSLAGCIILTLSHKPRAWRILPCLGIAVAIGHIVSGIRNFCCRLFVSGFQRNLEPWQSFASDDPKLNKIQEASNADEEQQPVTLAAAALIASIVTGKVKGHSPSSSASSFDFLFDFEETKKAEENVARFQEESSFKYAMEPGVTVMDPGLRKLHWNIFWQIMLGSWLTFAIACAICVPLPKRKLF